MRSNPAAALVLVVGLALVSCLSCLASCRAAPPARAIDGTIVCPEGTALDEMSDTCARFAGCRDHDGKLQGPAAETMEGSRAEGRYEGGLPTGTWRVVDARTGILLGTYQLEHGEGLERRWWPTGQLLWEGRVRQGSPDGTWRYFAVDGKVTRTEDWKNGQLVHEEGEPLCPGDVPDTLDRCPDDPALDDADDGCPEPADAAPG